MHATTVERKTFDAPGRFESSTRRAGECCRVTDDIATSKLDESLSVFVRARRRLFGIAYRILRNAADAEDIVQDVWLRWHFAKRSMVVDPTAFLMTTAAR